MTARLVMHCRSRPNTGADRSLALLGHQPADQSFRTLAVPPSTQTDVDVAPVEADDLEANSWRSTAAATVRS
jgi:hypothetical protein